MSNPAPKIIDGRYEVTRHLGRGSFGDVYEVWDHHQGQTVALKLLDPKKCGPWPWNEAATLTRLRSDYILPVWNASVAQGVPYVVTEVAKDGTAEDLMNTHRRPTPKDSVRLIRHASRGAARAHADDIVHRDIKLENVFVKDDKALLGDFGLAYPLSNGSAPRAGTLWTMAPESSSSVVSDVYSLGCSLYRLLTGIYPYEDENPRSEAELFRLATIGKPTPLRDFAPHVQAGLARIVQKAMDVDPTQRYQTAAELDSALGGLAPAVRDWTHHTPHSGHTECWMSGCDRPIEVCIHRSIGESTCQLHVAYVRSGRRIIKHCSPAVKASQIPAALRRVFRDLGC